MLTKNVVLFRWQFVEDNWKQVSKMKLSVKSDAQIYGAITCHVGRTPICLYLLAPTTA